MTVEDHDLCVKGLHVLTMTLGVVEAERFVMLMNRDAGDYTEWRRTHLYQNETLEELAEKAKEAGKRLREHEKISAIIDVPRLKARSAKKKEAARRRRSAPSVPAPI